MMSWNPAKSIKTKKIVDTIASYFFWFSTKYLANASHVSEYYSWNFYFWILFSVLSFTYIYNAIFVFSLISAIFWCFALALFTRAKWWAALKRSFKSLKSYSDISMAVLSVLSWLTILLVFSVSSPISSAFRTERRVKALWNRINFFFCFFQSLHVHLARLLVLKWDLVVRARFMRREASERVMS